MYCLREFAGGRERMHEMPGKPGILKALAVVAVMVVVVTAGQISAQEGLIDPYPLRPPDTASPRDTLQSFQRYTREAIQRWQNRESLAAFDQVRAKALRTLDLSAVPPAVRRDRGSERAVQLLEILDRIELPPLEEIPDAAAVQAEDLQSWTIPNTEITIARTQEGPQAGKFQFTARTIEQLPAFLASVEYLPYKPGALVGLYEDLIYSPGPLLPLEWTTGLPDFAYRAVLGQTVWQWLATLATLALVASAITLAYLCGRRLDHAARNPHSRRQLGRLVATLAAIPLLRLAHLFIDDGINITGTTLFVFQLAIGVVMACAIGWAILLVLKAIGEAIISYRRSRTGSIDAQLVRIIVRVLGIVVLIYLALYVAEWFGIPAAPLIASLGVGGLAIALAVRPTLENIVGGFILFADKPVRVGEFCMFNDKMGTVEEVGLRSTRIRALDRTLITVPNADFAQMEIVNFTRRDRMLMTATLGLRYETTPDQLRYVLTKLRELFVAHPRISPDPARARFVGFGQSSLNIEVFIYVLSADFNEFLGIAEDINLRIIEIIAEAGTGFAFPSQTAYFAKDQGLDSDRTRAAEAAVQGWRAEGALPFPQLDPKRVAALDGRLDFPPEGSVENGGEAPPSDTKAAAEAPRGRYWGRTSSAKRG